VLVDKVIKIVLWTLISSAVRDINFLARSFKKY